LLFGILALQKWEFISRDQLVAAKNAWVLDKEKPAQIVGQIDALSVNRA
jgi:hypothetical protein